MNDADLELLNAYADGELPTVACNAFEQRLLAEPELAAELAKIRKLKVALSGMHSCKTSVSSQGQRLGSSAVKTAAAGLLLAVMLGAGTYWINLAPPSAPYAVQIHTSYFDGASGQQGHPARVGDVLLTTGAVHVPDFAVSNLKLVELINLQGQDGIAAHYRGPRGCRVTVIADFDSQPVDLQGAGRFLTHGWRAGNVNYALIADGMDPNRFAALQRFAEAETQEMQQQDRFRTALAETTASSRPCA